MFPSPTKPGAVRAPLSLFAQAKALGVPLAAIGGITLDNAPQVIAAGARLLAGISRLFRAPRHPPRGRRLREALPRKTKPLFGAPHAGYPAGLNSPWARFAAHGGRPPFW